jgi:hypothetical protein
MKIVVDPKFDVGKYGEIKKTFVSQTYIYLFGNGIVPYNYLNGHMWNDLNKPITKKHRRMTMTQLMTYADFMTKNSPTEFSDTLDIVDEIFPMELGVVGNVARICVYSQNIEYVKKAWRFMVKFYEGAYDNQKIISDEECSEQTILHYFKVDEE